MTIDSSLRTAATTTAPKGLVAKAPPKTDFLSVMADIDFHLIQPDQALAALWKDDTLGANMPRSLNQLLMACSEPNLASDKIATRHQVSAELIARDPTMAKLGERVQTAIQDADGCDQQVDAKIKQLVNVHLKAREKLTGSHKNVFFSFLHLARLEVKGLVTQLLSACLTNKTADHDRAARSVEKTAVREEVKALLRHHIRSPQPAVTARPGKIGYVVLKDAKVQQYWDTLKPALDAMPTAGHANWPNVEKRMMAYLNHTASIQGAPFQDLLSHLASSANAGDPSILSKQLQSMEISCRLEVDTARQVAFQRQMWNIAQQHSPKEIENLQVTGWSTSLFNQLAKAAKPDKIPEIMRPGNQLGLAIDTPMKLASGDIVDVTIFSAVAPALDSEDQPDFSVYTHKTEEGKFALNKENYAKSFDAIKEQMLVYARDHPEKTEFSLAGIGVGAYLSGLGNEKARNEAREIATSKLAELAVELRKLGRSVNFTDINDAVLKLVNKHLSDMREETTDPTTAELLKDLGLAGSIPGGWIKPNQVILNAWDNHSLVGNMLAKDSSLDGYIGRNSLVHLVHALACAMEAEGISAR